MIKAPAAMAGVWLSQIEFKPVVGEDDFLLRKHLNKFTGFQKLFCEELTKLLAPRAITFEIIRTENTCLIGAALTAFAATI